MNKLLAILLSLASWNAIAQTPVPNVETSAPPVPAAPQLGAKSYLLVDFNSGRILVEHNPDMRVEPASITKLMTATDGATSERRLKSEGPSHLGYNPFSSTSSKSFSCWSVSGQSVFQFLGLSSNCNTAGIAQ